MLIMHAYKYLSVIRHTEKERLHYVHYTCLYVSGIKTTHRKREASLCSLYMLVCFRYKDHTQKKRGFTMFIIHACTFQV